MIRNNIKLKFIDRVIVYIFAIILFIAFIPLPSHAASFTASVSGNWNDGLTWGNTSPGTEGVDYPSTSGGDSVSIGAQKTVTIPSGHNAKASISSLAAGVTGTHTKLVINGSLTMQGTTTLNNFTELNLGAGGVLDIDNKAIYISTSTSVWLSWQGTSGSRATVKSTTPGGKFYSSTSAANVDINWQYVDITDWGNSIIGSGTSATQNILMSHLYFNNNADIQLLNNSMNAASTFLLEYSDFRNPVGTNKYFLHAFLSTATTTASRSIRNCTFNGGSVEGVLVTRSLPMTIDNVVFVKTNWKAYGLNGQVLKNSFHWNNTEVNGQLLNPLVTGVVLDNNFIYTTASNGHPVNLGASSTIMNNVFQATTDDSNFMLQPSTANANVMNNIGIGANFFVRHTSPGPTNTNLYNNTVLSENDNVTAVEAMLLMTETSDVLSGTAELRNNLMYNTNTARPQYGVSMDASTADQIDYADYNYWYGTPGGDVFDHYINVNITGKTEGVTEGFGANDRVADPNFVDSARRIATWDSSLSGPGTATNAITEMLKMNGTGGTFNSSYTPVNLINYMKVGLHPRNAVFRGVSATGGDIGALSVSNTAPSVAFGSISSSNSGNVSIPYTITDADSDTISIVAQYSTDNSTWSTATKGTGGDATTTLTSSSGGTAHTFVWNTTTDLPSTSDSTVWFRIRPSDGGGSLATTTSSSFGIDNVVPTITDITSTKANGTYGIGEVIDINLTFSEAVTSTGSVTVTLETGTTDRTCTFTVSNSTTGTCNYTVQSGDTTSDLTVSSVSGTISDAAGNAIVSFTPDTNLADNKALVIDTDAPTITNVSSSKPSGIYGIGSFIDIDLTFSEAVTASTSVILGLNSGGTCTFTVSNSSSATCNYIVASGESVSSLDVSDINGYIVNSAGHAMNNFVPEINLSANKTIVINTTMASSTVSPSQFLIGSSTNPNFIIDALGNVGIATSSPWRTLSLMGSMAIEGLTTSTDGNAVCILSNFELVSSGGTTCNTSSRSTKRNIVDITNEEAEKIIMSLRPVSFNYKESGDRRVGFIAEDVSDIDPRLVDYAKKDIKYNSIGVSINKGSPVTVEYANTVSIITKFIQSLYKDTNESKSRIRELERRIDSLQNEIELMKSRTQGSI